MSYKPKKKQISLVEFKAWLQGVEELHPKDWSPSAEQWSLIRAKIEQINVSKEVVKHVEETKSAPAPVQGTSALSMSPASPQPRPIPRGQNPVFIPAPPVPGGVPNLPLVSGSGGTVDGSAIPSTLGLPTFGGTGGSEFV